MKKLLYSGLALFLLVIVYLNVGLYYTPSFKTSIPNKVLNVDVYQQLQHLKKELNEEKAGIKMQNIFPEGFIFINSLYALSWVNLISELDSTDIHFQEGIDELQWAWNEINSERGKSTFDQNTPLEYGAYYRGWSNYVLGKKLLLLPESHRPLDEVEQFKDNCREIAFAISHSIGPYIESYHDQAWPADVLMTVASLHLHDQLFSPKYSANIKQWIRLVKLRLDPETGLIPHRVHPKTGRTLQGAQGSSQSLMLIFLHEIDQGFAFQQFDIYKSLFLDYRLGLPGIREYPKTVNGPGHIDSGPIIWQIGGAASVVGQRTMGIFHENETYLGLRNSIEAFGCGLTFNARKKYLFGALPMADAFIAWSNSHEIKCDIKAEQNWRSGFQFRSLISLFLVFLVVGILACRKRWPFR